MQQKYLITRDIIVLKILEKEPLTFNELRARFNTYNIPRVFSVMRIFNVRNLTIALNHLIELGLITSRPYKLTEKGQAFCKKMPALGNYQKYPKNIPVVDGEIKIKHAEYY